LPSEIFGLTTYDSDNDIYRTIKSRSERLFAKGCSARGIAGLHGKVNGGETCIPQGLMQKLVTGISKWSSFSHCANAFCERLNI
jgi:hypothetical protein